MGAQRGIDAAGWTRLYLERVDEDLSEWEHATALRCIVSCCD